MTTRRALRRARHLQQDGLQKLEEYRDLKRKLKVAIQKSKEQSLREFCNQVEASLGHSIQVGLKKLVGRRPISRLTLPGRLELIVDSLFPIHQATNWHHMDAITEIPMISPDEMKAIGSTLPLNKAPGPDRIPDVIINHVTSKRL